MSIFTPDMPRPGGTERYIIAYPNTFVISPTLEIARARANVIRDERMVKIFRLVEVETHFPRGKPPPPPRMPPTGTATGKAA